MSKCCLNKPFGHIDSFVPYYKRPSKWRVVADDPAHCGEKEIFLGFLLYC